MINIHVYNLYNPDTDDTISPNIEYYRNSHYRNNLDYVIKYLLRVDWEMGMRWLDNTLITDRMVERLPYHETLGYGPRETEVLRIFRGEIMFEEPVEEPIEDTNNQPFSSFNVTKEFFQLKTIYDQGELKKYTDKNIPEDTLFYESLLSLLNINRDGFKQLHTFIRKQTQETINFPEEDVTLERERQEDIKFLQAFNSTMNRVIDKHQNEQEILQQMIREQESPEEEEEEQEEQEEQQGGQKEPEQLKQEDIEERRRQLREELERIENEREMLDEQEERIDQLLEELEQQGGKRKRKKIKSKRKKRKSKHCKKKHCGRKKIISKRRK